MCNSSHGLDINASNYVAKSYIEVVDRDVYFQDVKLQMDAKLWGEEYNRHNPPKKVSPTSAIRSTCAVRVCDSFFFFSVSSWLVKSPHSSYMIYGIRKVLKLSSPLLVKIYLLVTVCHFLFSTAERKGETMSENLWISWRRLIGISDSPQSGFSSFFRFFFFVTQFDYVFINFYVQNCLLMFNLWRNTPSHKFSGFFL